MAPRRRVGDHHVNHQRDRVRAVYDDVEPRLPWVQSVRALVLVVRNGGLTGDYHSRRQDTHGSRELLHNVIVPQDRRPDWPVHAAAIQVMSSAAVEDVERLLAQVDRVAAGAWDGALVQRHDEGEQPEPRPARLHALSIPLF